MDSATRVGMVDSRQGFVDALCRCLSETADLVVVGTAPSLDVAADCGLFGACDVLMLGLDENTPMARLLDLSAAHPLLGIILIADADDEPLLLDAIASGARGWLTRQDGLDELLAAVRDVGRGESYYPTEPLRALLVSRLDGQGRAATIATHPLTRRESDVLSCLAAGMSRREVGEALDLSDNTVRTYVRRILRKLHVRSAPAAIALSADLEKAHG